MNKKKIIIFSGLVLVITVLVLGIPRLARDMLFYPPAPDADYPAPVNEVEAMLQDLDYLEKYVKGYDRSYGFRNRGRAMEKIRSMQASVETLTPVTFELGVSEVVAMAENGHSNVWSGPRARRHPTLPIRGYWFDDGYFVVAATPDYEDLLGKKITHIGDKTVEELAAMFRRYYGGEDSGFKGYSLPAFLQNTAFLAEFGMIGNANNPTLVYEDAAGNVTSRAVEALPADQDRQSSWPWGWLVPEDNEDPQFIRFDNGQNHAPQYLGTNDSFQAVWMEGEKALFVQYRRNSDAERTVSDFNDEIRAMVAQYNPEIFILDERFNGGGDYTLTADLMFELPDLLPANTPIYAITGHETFSAGISSLGFLKEAAGPRMTIVGRRIGDSPLSWGETNTFILPNSGIAMTASRGLHDQLYGCEDRIQCYWADFDYPAAVGSLDPDIPVPFTFSDYANGYDSALDLILATEAGN